MAGSRAVRYVQYIDPVRHGKRYSGYVVIGETRFDYDLRFTLLIHDLESEMIGSVQELRRFVRLSLTRDGTLIALTDDEYRFFLHDLYPFIRGFYYDILTRHNAQGLMGQILRGADHVGEGRTNRGITLTGTIALSPEHYGLLTHEKFGVTLEPAS